MRPFVREIGIFVFANAGRMAVPLGGRLSQVSCFCACWFNCVMLCILVIIIALLTFTPSVFELSLDFKFPSGKHVRAVYTPLNPTFI